MGFDAQVTGMGPVLCKDKNLFGNLYLLSRIPSLQSKLVEVVVITQQGILCHWVELQSLNIGLEMAERLSTYRVHYIFPHSLASYSLCHWLTRS